MNFNFSLTDWLQKRSFLRKRGVFYTEIASAYENGQPPEKKLPRMAAQLEKRNKTAAASFYRAMSKRFNGDFSKTLEGVVPSSEITIIEAHEKSGKLPEGLRVLADAVKAAFKMRKALRQAVVGPSMSLIMVTAGLVGFSVYFEPLLAKLSPPETWTGAGYFLYISSYILINYWWLCLALTVGAITGFIWSIDNLTGEVRNKLDSHLPYSLMRDYNGALMITALSSLLNAGTGIAESLEIMKRNGSPWYKWRIGQMQDRVRKFPSATHLALDVNILDEDTADRIMAICERGEFSGSMAKAAGDVMERTAEKIEAASNYLNVITMAMAGFLMMLLYVGFTDVTQGAIANISNPAAVMAQTKH